MSDLTHIQRALRILQRLMTHDRVMLDELHELLDRQVAKRSIQRVLQTMEGANYFHYAGERIAAKIIDNARKLPNHSWLVRDVDIQT